MNTLKDALALIATLTTLAVGPVQVAAGTPPPIEAAEDPQPVQPPSSPPMDPPPPPPAVRPNPPSEPPQAPPQEEAPAGQWVYTSQYGWVWMPFGDNFTHVPPDGSTPNMYVYYPEVGWSWVIAPWLWGWGPMPYFGLIGPRAFGWYGVGLGRWYGFAGRHDLRGGYGRGYWNGGRWNGVGNIHATPPAGGTSAAPQRPSKGQKPAARGNGRGEHR
jgi:hypothetical protein